MKILQIGSSGVFVQLLQSTLKKLDFYDSNIDGMFGLKTAIAVKNFQSQFGLVVDGIVGKNTWEKLYPYISGYTTYTVNQYDTLSSISTYFDTSINRILASNPNLSRNSLLFVGQELIIPFGNIIPTDISYTYDILQLNLLSLKKVYPFLDISTIGYSVMGKDLPVIKIGNGSNKVFYSGAIHANEWITSPVLMKFVEDFCLTYINNSKIYNYNAKEIFNNSTIFIAPMMNPDAIDLVTDNLPKDSAVYMKAKKISEDYPNISFPEGWKSNISGIDLNLQFPADWQTAKEIKYSQGYTSPAPRDFVGYGPLTEPEALAIYNFTLQNNFRLILAYHTQGEVIFWKYKDFVPQDSILIGESFSKSSGYPLLDTPYSSAFAGYKDWFIKNYNKPGYTIEAGLGENPLPISDFDKIYNDNIGILVLGAIL